MDSKKKLIERVLTLYPESSRTRVKEWIVHGRILVNGNVEKKPHFLVNEEDNVALAEKKKVVGKGIRVVYEDPHFVVIDKPSGLLSVPLERDVEESAFAVLKRKYGSTGVFIVHRLDKDTSGVMVFARSKECRDRLKGIFEKHDIYREYRGVVEGKLEKKEGTLKAYLKEGSDLNVRVVKSKKDGELAITKYKVLKEKKEVSIVRFVLETGKKNQIRVHCKMIGHPIRGDKKYGSETPFKRLCLHAHVLSFNHPYFEKKMVFKSPVPTIFGS